MNRTGIRIVAVQVVIVGALLLVIYLTLLQPEEQKPLFGVGVPTGPGQVAQAPAGSASGPAGGGAEAGEGQRGDASRAGRAGRGAGNRGAPGGRRPGSANAYSGSEAAEAAQAPALPVPTRDGAQGGVTPTEDQYDDTVGRLFGNL
jgi:hypothetical protein